MVPAALAVVTVRPGDGLESVTAKPSLASPAVSPWTAIVMILEVSPAANVALPDGEMPPAKSAALAGLAPEPATDHATLCDAEVSPPRVRVKVKAVDPALPSALLALLAAIATVASSFWMVPVALGVPRTTLPVACDSVTVKISSASAVVSPWMATVTVLTVSPAAKLRVSPGMVPPTKSVVPTELPSPPVTDQLIVAVVPRALLRVTLKVKAVVPPLPSAFTAEAAAIVTVAGSGTTT